MLGLSRHHLRCLIGRLNVAAQFEVKTAALQARSSIALHRLCYWRSAPTLPSGRMVLIFGIILSLADAIITKSYARFHLGQLETNHWVDSR